MQPNKNWLNILLFTLLSFIWGSSFILMKIGLYDNAGNAVLSAYQVASLRILSAGIVLLPVGIQKLRNVPGKKIGFIILSGLLGSFFPAYLFCIAETRIDSSLAASINALTPFFSIIFGFLLFRSQIPALKIIGIVAGLAGCIGLLFSKRMGANENIFFAFFVVCATVFYALNVNLVRHKLHDIGSTTIASFAFASLIIPAAIILLYSGYFKLPFQNPAYLKATLASIVLGVIGTAIASIIFYMMVKRGGVIFASMVTYAIPFVALFWGWLAGENITGMQVLCLVVILCGVYIANINRQQ